ncbi:hypothetical protein [Actinoplanes sp. HUAS TT8]|uniref:hypothetical protein n=1 Tax=Actinoplanes sp. HUAS TT8 TaxID=3447453 RepID=UPI003F525DAE
MNVRKMLLATAAGAAVLTTGACAAGTTSTTTAPAGAVTSPAPLAPAWYSTGGAAAPTVAPAQVAPGAYHPVATSTGLYLAVSPATSTSPAVIRSVAPTANCSPMLGPATNVPVAATAGTGTITARWTDLSDPSVLTYRVAAIPNSGAPTTWLTLAPTHTCKTLTTTITGLAKGHNYEIWLDATYRVSGVTQETMIGRSAAVTVL